MRNSICLNRNWTFYGPKGTPETINLPHTWNAVDGQDGGNDYWRGACTYETTFPMPEFDPDTQTVYLEFQGVNASADVELNGTAVIHHDGGYSTFRAEVAGLLQAENHMTVRVDNSVNDRVYPQKADFTFYGGIYRDVTLLVANKHHFDLDFFGGPGLRITPALDGTTGKIRVESWTNVENPTVEVILTDAAGATVATGQGADVTLDIPNVHLWDGVKDPYLYTATLRLVENGTAVDQISSRFGVRTFRVDPKEGFFLNGRRYPLHGVSRHQDRKGLGNALTKAHHDEDMDLIREIGANTIRLAHYQHDQYFYDLCDQYGMIVWAEIPYISEHMPNGRDNTISQMKELIIQNYNHPSIVTWGLSNEITISTKDKADMLDNHRVLNDLWMDFFHTVYPHRPLGFSEYGAEGMPNLHSSKPRRGDHTEEYQAIYHEYMLRCFERHPWLWATHVWNMYDFAADARDQGGEPGMNHKGLVTFDRKTKKDSFYLYKAYWSEEPLVHLCGSRYTDRTEQTTTVKVYSNQSEVSLYANGKLVETKKGDRVFTFKVPLSGQMKLEARAGKCRDTILIRRVEQLNEAYKLKKGKSSSANWV